MPRFTGLRELGVNFLATAYLYGPELNERLVRLAVAGERAQYTIATKFGYEIDDRGQLSPTFAINGRPDYIRKAIDRSLQNLGTDYIDLYYMHRPDPNVPIEESVGAMAELVQAGKVRYLGLSEVGPELIRRAHAVHPLTAIQTEYSLFDRGGGGRWRAGYHSRAGHWLRGLLAPGPGPADGRNQAPRRFGGR